MYKKILLLLLTGFLYQSGFCTLISVRLIKEKASRCLQKPSLTFLAERSAYHLVDRRWYNGENDWEIFFEIETNTLPLAPENISISVPGVIVSRAIIGRTDVNFTKSGDNIILQLVNDTADGRHVATAYQNPKGGPHIWFFHNWQARVNGDYLNIPYPAKQLAASLNCTWACAEMLLQMNDVSGLHQSFYGRFILLNCESSAPRAHLDFPPHWHLEHWEDDYDPEYGISWRKKQYIIPHYYLDSSGAIVKNKQSITRDYLPIASVPDQFEKDDTCTWTDREGNPIFKQVIKTDGLYFFKPDGEEWSIRPDPEQGGSEAVWIFRGNDAMARTRATDNGEKGRLNLQVDYYQEGRKTGSWSDSLIYDRFTGKKIE